MYSYTQKVLWLLGGLVALTTIGCGDGDDDLYAERYERPEEARKIVSDKELKRLEDAGMEIYGGSNPPQIAATYHFGDDVEIRYKSREELWSSPAYWCDELITYTAADQPSKYTSSMTSNNCDLEGESEVHYISGEGSCFTLYSRGQSTFEGCTSERIGVLSACLADNGDLENPLSGGITVSASGDTCEQIIAETRMPAPNDLTIIGYTSKRAVLVTD